MLSHSSDKARKLDSNLPRSSHQKYVEEGAECKATPPTFTIDKVRKCLAASAGMRLIGGIGFAQLKDSFIGSITPTYNGLSSNMDRNSVQLNIGSITIRIRTLVWWYVPTCERIEQSDCQSTEVNLLFSLSTAEVDRRLNEIAQITMSYISEQIEWSSICDF